MSHRWWRYVEQDRHAGLADRLQELEVLHVARPDLEHINVAGHQGDIRGVHHLAGDGHAVLLTRFLEVAQPLLAEALEGVWAGTRLEGAATEDHGTCLAHRGGDLHDLLSALHRTRPCYDGDSPATDLNIADGDDGIFFSSRLAS